VKSVSIVPCERCRTATSPYSKSCVTLKEEGPSRLDFCRIGLNPEAGAGSPFEFAHGGFYASPPDFAAGSDLAARAGAWCGAG